MKIRKEINELLIKLKKIRRQLHMFPEIGFDTYNTVQLIKQFINMKPVEDDGISLVYYLPSNGKTIAFRCELDGLNIQEENQVVYKSNNHFMHACGHDLHMAIMILMINIFSKKKHNTSLLFIFQPAEESGAGALHIINKGIIDKYNVDELYAFHVLPNLGDFIGCKEGLIMAQSVEFNIHIKGIGGHLTSNNTIDSIKSSNLFLNEFYKLQKELSPHRIHVGTINGGTICNSIAQYCEFKGTIRCLDKDSMISIKELIEYILIKLDKKYKTVSSIDYSIGYSPLINHVQLVEKIKVLSEDTYIEIEPLILSEDFSYYCDYCKCCYMFCGLTTNEELHSSTFDLKEEDCLKMLELFNRIIENT